MTSSASKENLQDDVLVVDSGSFWEPGQYRRTVKRVDDGYSMCKELVNMIRDRCEIETKYAQALKKHAEDWHKKIEHSPAYGTMKTAWNSVLREAEQQHDLHLERRDRLTDQLVATVKSWLKDNYQKQTIPKPFLTKQAKEMDENFKRAQKQWSKLYDKVGSSKKQYYGSCQKEQMALNVEKNAKADQGKSQDERLKLKDKVDKAADDKTKTKEKYDHALKEITNYNAKYIDDMQLVFDSCQAMEQKRLSFFKEGLFGLHRSLYIYEDPRLKQIYLDMFANIDSSDSNLDLKYWSDNYGVGMAMYWPSFEEFSPEGTMPSKKYAKLATIPGGLSTGATNEAAMLTAGQAAPESVTPQASPKPADGKAGSSQQKAKPSSNPFGDDEKFDEATEGLRVRALYGYNGSEEDELTFKEGDEFIKLEDEDEQGWCKGKIGDTIGLYPSGYVEELR